jgi:sulfite exporter TauE/SafE
MGAVADPGVAVFFVVGLLGGAHCLGMCGPLVTLYAESLDRGRGLSSRELRQHALFNAGRTASYATIGAVAAAAGGVLYDASALAGVGGPVRGAVGVAVGVLVMAAGVSYLFGGTNALSTLEVPGVGRVSAALTARANTWVEGPRIAALGALHGLLPCPILYPAFLAAFAAGAPVDGAVSLAALGLGTFPTLFLYGTVVGAVTADTRRRLHRVLGVAFLALGYLPLSMGLGAFGVRVPMVPVPFYQPL